MGKTATTFDARNKHNLPVVNSQGGTSTLNGLVHASHFSPIKLISFLILLDDDGGSPGTEFGPTGIPCVALAER